MPEETFSLDFHTQNLCLQLGLFQLLKSMGVVPCSGRHIKVPFRWRFSLLRCVFHLLSGSCPFSENHSLNREYTIGPFQQRQTKASFSNSLFYALLPSFPRIALGSFGDLLADHYPSYPTAIFHFFFLILFSFPC